MSSDAITTAEDVLTPIDAPEALDDAPVSLRPTLATRAAALWQTVERVLVYAGDWLNPILVKETRQALKSFQFTVTFVLVLAACWMVTIGVVAYIGPRIYYSADGGTLLLWYYAVLAFPLIVVVPYAAFRSLMAEREDNTYDLLAITTLKPRQIISGKLGSSVVQMAVYFSAITPCLAFTYLLRGVDVPTIAVLLVYTFFWSLGLSMFGILLATLSSQRVAQVFISVVFVAMLIWMLTYTIAAAWGTVFFSYAFLGGDEFWISVAAVTTFYVTSFALAYFAAAGMITFTSENRSTPLRICMLLQQAALVGWMAYAWIASDFILMPIFLLATFGCIYWYIMGTMLTAERPNMSQRIRRRLPSSFLGRVFFSWLNPGPASGYMFVVANASALVVICLFAVAASDWLATAGPGPGVNAEQLVFLLFIGWGYLVGYLGLGMIVVQALRRFAVVTMLGSVLIHILIVLAGAGIPAVIQAMSPERRYLDYSLLQVSNPFWSLKHLADGGMLGEAYVLVILVPAAAICILLVNLRGVVRELQAVRVAPPQRVLEDEAQLHPAPDAGPSNPWDEE